MKNYSRRKFIKASSAVGAFSILGSGIISRQVSANPIFRKPDLCVVKGADYFQNTLRAIKEIKGLKNAFNNGKKVGLLVNSDFRIEGAFVNPDIVLATIEACIHEGAEEIVCLQNIKPEFWERSKYNEKFEKYKDKIISIEANTFPAKFDQEYFIRKEPLTGTKCLKKAEIVKELFECDIFINIPIAKHHSLTHYTGALKNMMGVCTRDTNVFFHLGGEGKNDPDFLGQCIADINTVRRPDLIVVDATKMISTGGPVGPGEMKQADAVVAGKDLVAIDALCCQYLDYSPEEINAIVKGHETGLGEIELSKLKIKEYIN